MRGGPFVFIRLEDGSVSRLSSGAERLREDGGGVDNCGFCAGNGSGDGKMNAGPSAGWLGLRECLV